MNKLLLFYLVFLMQELPQNPDIEGSWWRIDEDCTYYELYIDDSNLVECNSGTGGSGFFYSYKIDQDSIYIFYENQLENIAPYKFDNTNILYLYFGNKWHIYHRLKENINNYFLIKPEDEIGLEKFYFEFEKRGIYRKASKNYKNCN